MFDNSAAKGYHGSKTFQEDSKEMIAYKIRKKHAKNKGEKYSMPSKSPRNINMP
tara:strand:+ start:237 stop:398 length:162 start_codon:yes stop_codon:yes gene_type:complete